MFPYIKQKTEQEWAAYSVNYSLVNYVSRILITKHFGNSSTDVCIAIAEFIKKFCTSDNLSLLLEAFLACC